MTATSARPTAARLTTTDHCPPYRARGSGGDCDPGSSRAAVGQQSAVAADPGTAPLWPTPFCAACRTMAAAIYFEMTPGPDRLRWSLCARCWRTT
jgi:hypothetical protein